MHKKSGEMFKDKSLPCLLRSNTTTGIFNFSKVHALKVNLMLSFNLKVSPSL